MLSANELANLKEYWGQYGLTMDPRFTSFFKQATGVFDVRFLSQDVLTHDIIWFLNPPHLVGAYSDKNLLDSLFPQTKQPRTLVRRISGGYYTAVRKPVPEVEAIGLASKANVAVIKPAFGQGGADVKVLREPTFDKVAAAFRTHSGNFLVQEFIQQAPALASITPDSIVLFRVETLHLDGRVVVLNSSVAFGVEGNAVTNRGLHGAYAAIDSSGEIADHGYSTAPPSKISMSDAHNLESLSVPQFPEVLELAVTAHTQAPWLGLIAWDITLDKDEEAVMLEPNVRTPGITRTQLLTGPFFGDYTDEILAQASRDPSAFWDSQPVKTMLRGRLWHTLGHH